MDSSENGPRFVVLTDQVRSGYEYRLKACGHVSLAATIVATLVAIKEPWSDMSFHTKGAMACLMAAVFGSTMCHMLYGYSLTGPRGEGASLHQHKLMIRIALGAGAFEWFMILCSAGLAVTGSYLYAFGFAILIYVPIFLVTLLAHRVEPQIKPRNNHEALLNNESDVDLQS